uniref:Uncharacterized protein n=1 Tax=Quercus lobata TaxID=97700 RepID=A0A7N2RAX7_QUELO
MNSIFESPLRERLQIFLSSSDLYDPEEVLYLIEGSELWLEKAILYRKLGQEALVLQILALINTEENEDEVTENEENSGSASTSASTEESIELSPARARPQTVNRAQTSCTLTGYSVLVS